MAISPTFHGVDIRSIVIAPDGRSVAISVDDRIVHLERVQTGQELLSFTDLLAPVNQPAFSPLVRRTFRSACVTLSDVYQRTQSHRPAWRC